MYPELDEPIPRLDQYLNRLDISRPKQCDLEYLDALILAHQYAVPFENLDVHDEHLPISLATEKIFEKVAVRRRGGYCFELNALFARALEALGYKVSPRLARVVVDKDYGIPPLHRLTVVDLPDAKYVCDVGFGGAQPGFALRIEDGRRQTALDQTFRIDKIDDRWRISYHSQGDWEPTMVFTEQAAEDVDFIAPNFYCYACAESMFVNRRIVNLRTREGHKSIDGDLFIVGENGKRTETPIKGDESLREILLSHFGIEK
ncbi:MAG: arylamine N-acetyltransferase [Clostridiales Family XIII bacterium]|jgi:N-hydroxyarylamine O-acetyltransferase|nr:arylamine N-acetyltransferase [Clostridiales Family XIII bacterium]